jgi:transposase
MNTNNTTHNQKGAVVDSAAVIYIGFDLHTKDTVAVVRYGEMVPKPPRKMPTDGVLSWIKQLRKAHPQAEIHSCYEAGPCGYWLHRQLVAEGVHNVVVAPTALNGKRKTDQRDAQRLGELLVQHVQGNRHACSVVAVPSPEQEDDRRVVRHRRTLLKELGRCSVRGASLARLQGHKLPRRWWGPRNWPAVKETLPAALALILEDYHQQATLLWRQLQAQEKRVAELARQKHVEAPRGVGALTWMTLLLEVVDWHRFQNRRQVASYTGLCPGEYTSGGQRRELSIDKRGNRCVRHALVEATWRLMQWQPDYPPLAKLRAADGRRARKRAVVAVARRLAIDLWRLATGQTTKEKLHLTSIANPLNTSAKAA